MRKLGLWLVGTMVVLLACGEARKVAEGAPVAACARCHGGADNQTGAPPRDLQGRVDPSLPSVGAHTAHVSGGPFAPAFDCTACHPKPTTTTSPGHLDGKVTIEWSPLATANGALQPAYDPVTGCSAVYCHGSFFGGNAGNAPAWTAGAAGGACGSCHLVPPPASTGHPQRTGCGDCHGGYTASSVNLATHVNGRVDLLPLSCSACHGDPDRVPTTLNPQLAAAPPADNAGSVSTTSPGVGAHQAHLQDGALRGAMACTECHAVPSSMVGHPNGQTGFAWGPLATGDGLAAPAYAGGSCSATYCHGATLAAGGTNTAPAWTGGLAEVACGACHRAPPPSPHVQNTNCGTCHPGYTATAVNAALHVNGQVELVGLTCSSCHGDPLRSSTTVNPHLAAAPPVDTTGSSDPASPGVGAHLAHLQDGALRTALPCSSCHTVPSELGHATGLTELAWSDLATAGGNTVPFYAGGSCWATYCHGSTLVAGGTNTAPSWTGGAGQAACGTCHGAPPPASTGHTQSTNCGGCHPGYALASANPATHVDGAVQVQFSCTSCHGDTSRADTALNPRLSASPPLDTLGRSDPSLAGVGAHQAHLRDGALRVAMACTECHVVPASLAGHPTGATELAWGPLATGNATTSPAYAGGTCSNVYCHGSSLAHGGTNHAPSWTGGAAQVACGTCHGAPPPLPHPQTTNCGGCHAGYTATTANVTTHVNGTLDIVPLTCSSCHGDPARAPTALNPVLPAAPPVDTGGGSDPAMPGVGAHQAHLQDGTLRVAMACTECHLVPSSMSHSNGAIDFGWGPLATGNVVDSPSITSPSYAGGSCSNVYCHGSNLAHGGTNHAPSWTGGVAEVACGTCHGAPPPPPHLQNTNCGGCHGSAYSLATVDPATHVNGQLDVANLTCTSCHGDSSRSATPTDPRWAAPPVDTFGSASSTRVGAHQAHLAATWSSAVACTQCHPVPPGFAGHPTGATDFAWGTLATGAITAIANTNPAFGNFSPPTVPSFAGGSCSATYCHGGFSGTYTYDVWLGGEDFEVRTFDYAGKGATPSWPGGPMACDSCHGNPTRSANVWHSGSHAGGSNCQLCHPDASGVGGVGTAITDPARHVNGVVDLAPQWVSFCSNCH